MAIYEAIKKKCYFQGTRRSLGEVVETDQKLSSTGWKLIEEDEPVEETGPITEESLEELAAASNTLTMEKEGKGHNSWVVRDGDGNAVHDGMLLKSQAKALAEG